MRNLPRSWSHSVERSILAVPVSVLFVCSLALVLQIVWALMHPRLPPGAKDLSPPPTLRVARLISIGEPVAYAKVMNIYLQAHDNPPGASIPFHNLDYHLLVAWLDHILDLDPEGQYPLLAATRLYGSIADQHKQRLMLDFVYRRFLEAPDARWQWLAHATYIARHQLRDLPLAAKYAESLRTRTSSATVPAWARQMEIFLRADMHEIETAKILLGGLLASGQVSDPAEYRFLAGRLSELDDGGAARSKAK